MDSYQMVGVHFFLDFLKCSCSDFFQEHFYIYFRKIPTKKMNTIPSVRVHFKLFLISGNRLRNGRLHDGVRRIRLRVHHKYVLLRDDYT